MDKKSASKPVAAKDEEFVNTGLAKWEDGRRQWLEYDASSISKSTTLCDDQQRCLPSSKKKKKGAVNIDVDNIVELILSNKWRLAAKGGKAEKAKATFDTPVPLPQLVDILVDLWESESLDV